MAAEKPGIKPERSGEQRRARKLKATISIIGAGRLGTALARALALCGYEIEALVARRLAHARRAAKLVSTGPRALAAAQLDQLPPSDVIIIATPDDRIAETASRLAAFASHRNRRRIALHTSGALSSDILAPLRKAGFVTGSLHPLVSISDPVAGAERLRTAFYGVEGERAALSRARSIVRDLGGQSFSLNAKDKALYHAAAVMTSGHMVALFDMAVEMLKHCGLDEKRARRVLLPLLRSTLENLVKSESSRALTGTFARADIKTVRRHLSALRSQNLPDALAAYTLLGHRSLQLAAKRGADRAALREIIRELEKQG
jgi:predicted short-subunit dehydrogenase-like oxidoreductase (DUF2520 family)